MNGRNPREIAARVLQRRREGGYVEHLLDSALARTALLPADRHLCQELVYGIARRQATLDWLIDRKATSGVQQTGLRTILQLGLYQLFWLERIPPHAAVNETVELARHSGFGAQSGFVNALLRGYIRELDATRALLEDLKTSQPHIGYSHPQWLVDRWQKRWGIQRAGELMDWNNTPPKTYARVNALRTTPEKLLPQWRDEKVDYDWVRRDWLEENLVFELKKHPALAALPSFKKGFFYVQDPSTLLAVKELEPEAGHDTLDLCAAPGGKLGYIAQLMENTGKLVAHDISPERLKLVQENCTRLGVVCTTSTSVEEFRNRRFDRILLDAPCSNTGVMRRRVDSRWRIQSAELDRLRATQLELLGQAAPLLDDGGRLVYSTCSLEPEENREIVDAFLAGNPGLKLARDRELVPFTDHVDGAYVAVLEKE